MANLSDVSAYYFADFDFICHFEHVLGHSNILSLDVKKADEDYIHYVCLGLLWMLFGSVHLFYIYYIFIAIY